MQTHKKLIFTYGFAIFAMFFGSGNLVFPLQIGTLTGANWLFGFIGLLFTGIFLPFLGLFVIKLHKGDYLSFFKEAGPLAGFVLPFVTLSLLGSFGVIPRCITVAHGGVNHIAPNLSLTLFSFIFCLCTFFLCLKDQLMVKILGKWLSPLLLGTLILLIVAGVYAAPEIVLGTPTAAETFHIGFLTGYQTMDLFAAFFFSALIFNQIKDVLPKTDDNKVIIKAALPPSIIGATMLAVIYFGFVFLGSHYGHIINITEVESFLPSIAHHILGSYAAIIIALTVFFSCLTTAIALNNIYARYLMHITKMPSKYFPLVLLATTGSAFYISLFDFKGISAFLGPILEVTYPGLIALTIFSIVTPRYKYVKIITFYALLSLMLILNYT